MLRLYADFNEMTEDGNSVFIAADREIDQETIRQLAPGLRVILYQDEDDFEVEAIVEPEEAFPNRIFWYGRLDWNTLKQF
jgi:hypothetical protein